jgi:NAD(P)-dependent dehydrogenase (short-subunit alcohol dehydrogenase family)
MSDLDGKVALVTGVGPNIGQAIARTLAKSGASVACNDLDEPRVREIAADIVRNGGKAIAVAGDITDAQAVNGMLAAAEVAFGRVDILVNNAIFIGEFGSILTARPDEWYRTLEVILSGAFLCSRAVAQRLVDAKKPGVIVNIASVAGHRGRPGAVAYCTAKSGILNMTRAMAIDLAPYGIRVCSATPTATGSGPQMNGWVHKNAAGIPIGRLGEPQDIADAVAFLASDRAAFITGEDLRVDGGALATWNFAVNAAATS